MTQAIHPSSMQELDQPAVGREVSIIMRTRARPVLLARALSSVLSQSYADWRLILVNDGGAQASVEALVEEYRAAFAGRITLLHHAQGLGMEGASNTGLAAATGDFVCLHDDDDSWHPDFLATLTGFLNAPENRRYAAAVCHCTVVHETLEPEGINEQERLTGFHSPDQVDYAAMLRSNQFPPISMLLRRRVVDAVGRFNTDMPVLGDWDYNLRILAVGDIGVVPRRLCAYHHRLASELGPYGSSVISRAPDHQATRTLYRNSMMRRLAERDPALLGLVHVVLSDAQAKDERLLERVDQLGRTLLQRSWDTETWDGWRHSDLRDRLVRVEAQLAELGNSLAALRETMQAVARALRPFRAAWRRMMPLRRLLARARGRHR